jgi:hypothetical protein
MDLHMKSLSVWFDIWGGMEGNINESMATAIECSRVLLVFLSDKYIKSVNCQLEFKYAVACGKPFVFVHVEPNLKIEDWLEPYYKDEAYPKFELHSYNDASIMHNGVPRVHVIAQAIRDIGAAQPAEDIYELSDEIVGLKELLNNALDDLAELSGQTRFRICTRCAKQFDDNNLIGCKTHRAYYLGGGGLLEGRWVCCGQQAADSIGCQDANHISEKRTWTRDSYYGTHTWIPN